METRKIRESVPFLNWWSGLASIGLAFAIYYCSVNWPEHLLRFAMTICGITLVWTFANLIVYYKKSNDMSAKFIEMADHYGKCMINVIAETRETKATSIEAKDCADASRKILNNIILNIAELNDLKPIDVGVSNFNNFFIYAPLYVASGFNFFAQEDLLIKPHHLGNDDKALEFLLDGGCHLAITDPGIIFHNGKYNDKGLKILAPLVNKVALWGIFTKDIGINEIKQITTYASPSTSYLLIEKWRTNNNIECTLKPKTVDDFILDSENIVSNSDLICVTEPERTWYLKKYPQLKGFAKNEIDFNNVDLFPNRQQFNFTAVITTQREIDYNSEVLRRFLKALRVAYNIIYSATPSPPGQPKSSTYEGVINAISEKSIATYKNPLTDIWAEEDTEHILELLKTNSYFSKTIVYNKDERKGLENAIKLRVDDYHDYMLNNILINVKTHRKFKLSG